MGAIASQITSLAIVYSIVYSDADQSKKTPKLRVTGLCAGNSPGTGEFPAQMGSYAENVSISWRHHGNMHLNYHCIRQVPMEWCLVCDISPYAIDQSFLYARLKNGRITPWQCPSVCPSVRPRFPDFSSSCFEISIWNLVYTFSRWHDMSSLSCITIGSLWLSLQPKVGPTHFWQSWPHKSR